MALFPYGPKTPKAGFDLIKLIVPIRVSLYFVTLWALSGISSKHPFTVVSYMNQPSNGCIC